MKKFITFFIALVLIMSTITTEASELTQKKVMVYMKPDVNVTLYDKTYKFEDANGQRVYPIINNGIAYFPVRAVTSLMKKPIRKE